MIEQDRKLPITELRNGALFSVDGLSYKYPLGDRSALEEISFNLRQGEVLGVVGESGSGKSTLLYAISGYIPHFFKDGEQKGNIHFNGKDIQEQSLIDMMREMSVVFQDPSTQTFGMKVEDALVFGMENIAVPRDEIINRLNLVSEQLGITHLFGRSTLSLSGGESQAVAIASMLAMNPKAILFDETISALDAAGQQRVRSIIKNLRQQNKTMLVVDSDVIWLSQNVDRLLILQDGHLIYNGDPAAVASSKELSAAAGVSRNNGNIDFRERAKGETVIHVENLTFSYDGINNVLENVNLDIRSGSCTAFVGHNGSGKSTLAQIISGGLKPTSGRIITQGKELYHESAIEAVKQVGYVYQNPSRMFSNHTVEDEYLFTPKILDQPPFMSLDAFGIDHLSKSSPWELSAGQQQLLALASVVAANPDVVIFDEPTLGQTKRARERITEIIYELQNKGKTVILISHDMEFVARSAQEVHLFDKGRLIKSGGIKEVFYDDRLFEEISLPLPLHNQQ